jgi:hypothetical protein
MECSIVLYPVKLREVDIWMFAWNWHPRGHWDSVKAVAKGAGTDVEGGLMHFSHTFSAVEHHLIKPVMSVSLEGLSGLWDWLSNSEADCLSELYK